MPLGVYVSWVSSSRKSGARPDERGQPKDFGAWQTINIVLLIHLDPFPPLESLSFMSHVVFRESNQSERKFYPRISQQTQQTPVTLPSTVRLIRQQPILLTDLIKFFLTASTLLFFLISFPISRQQLIMGVRF